MDELTEDAAQEIERVHARWIEFEVAAEHHSLMAMCAVTSSCGRPTRSLLLDVGRSRYR